MKHFILKVAWQPVIPLIALMFALISCDDNDSKKGAQYDPNAPIVLTTFEPDSGRLRDMVLLNGSNFGTDPSAIKVFFNSSEAKVVGSTGTRILARVPRLPGDTCILSVQIGNQKKEYLQEFRYKVAASVTTFAGNGEPSNTGEGNEAIWENGLDNSRITPVYMGIDNEDNLFVSVRPGYLFYINTKENTIRLIATEEQHGYIQRCPPYINPRNNVIQTGGEGAANRDRFLFLDPKTGWAPSIKYIKSWDWNKLPPPAADNNSDHPHCILNEEDGYYYTRYRSGLIAKIDPETWHSEAIGMTPSGQVLGLAFHPINKNELWIGYWGSGTSENNGLCTVDVSDTTKFWNADETAVRGLMTTYKRRNSIITAIGYRDGPLNLAQFNQMRQINFDSQGNLFVGDSGNDCIRMVNTKTMMVETIIGIPGQRDFKDGNRDEALFNQPQGLVVDSEDVIYVSDWGNNRLRRVAIE